MAAQRYDVQLRQGMPTASWVVIHQCVSRGDARALASKESTVNRARIVATGTDQWAQCFEVRSPGKTQTQLEAVFWCEFDAQAYVFTLLRELGVVRCHVRELWRCYGCDSAGAGLRDRRPEGGDLEMACDRHRDPRLGWWKPLELEEG